MRKIMRGLVVMAVISGIFVFVNFPGAKVVTALAQSGKPVELRAVTCYPETNKLVQGFWMLRDKLNQLSKGELSIKWVGGPEAIGPFQQGAAVKRGVVDMAWVFGSFYTAQVPAAQLLSFSLLTAQEERQNGAYDFMNDLHKEAGIYYLGRGYVNAEKNQFSIFTNKRIKSSQELSGMKMGPGTNLRPFQKEIGIAAVTMPQSELYGALERKIVDGLIQPMSVLTSFGWQEVVKYMIDPPFLVSNVANIINLNTWNKLPKHLQDILLKAQIETEREIPAYDINFRKTEWEKLKAAGIEVITLAPTDSKSLIETMYRVEWDYQLERLPPAVGQKVKKLYSTK